MSRPRCARIALTSFSIAAVCAQVLACGGLPSRTAVAYTLKTGEPRTQCEREEWYELVPAQVTAKGTEVGVGMNTHYWAEYQGVGVFRYREAEPEELEDVWPKMNEPALEHAHQSRIEPVDAANRRALYWSLGGVGAIGLGVGTAAAIQDGHPTEAAVAGVSGLVLGVAAVVMVLVSQPSGYDQVEADARRTLLIPKEDDLGAAKRGIERANQTIRVHCSGN